MIALNVVSLVLFIVTVVNASQWSNIPFDVDKFDKSQFDKFNVVNDWHHWNI